MKRFFEKINKTETCWIWTATINRGGYGMFRDGKMKNAHRVSYEIIKGPIPEGLFLDHICRVRHCVNPDHLEPVTNKENVLRGESICAKNKLKTHCKRGHEFISENIIIESENRRRCKTCYNERQNQYRKTEKSKQYQKNYHANNKKS